jgi:carboxypeptidase D
MLNPHAFNEVSNMLFISQPLGTGFSYAEEEAGSINDITDDFQNTTIAPGVTGSKLLSH